MSSMDNLAKDLYITMTESDKKKPKPYDTRATVVRVDPDEPDKLWVHIPGGVEETEVRKTIDAKVGDSVQVRVSSGRAWLTGNTTAPPTDDTKANAANTKAVKAELDALKAQMSAESAERSARQAQLSADDAARAADNAWGYAGNANEAAIAANDYAGEAYNEALKAQDAAKAADDKAKDAGDSAHAAATMATAAQLSLSEVQNVMDTLTWMQEHGYYRYCASDTDPVEGKVYYILEGEAVITPTGSPSKQGFYEQSTVGTNTIFVKSTDTEVVSGTTYYTVTPYMVQDPESPSANMYYELIMDETMTEYVNTHLALDALGLWLLPYGTPESSVPKVLVSAHPDYAGITIYNENNVPIAHYGTETTIGDPNGFHISINGTKLSFYEGPTEVAYVSNNQLYITKTVVLDEMQLNTKWKWKYDPSDDSIYLKWI